MKSIGSKSPTFCKIYLFLALMSVCALSNATVQEDIAALAAYSREAKLAGTRLLRQGRSSLAAIYPVLERSENYTQLLQLTTLLAEIGEEKSVQYIIRMASKHQNNVLLVQTAILSLGSLPQTTSSYNYVSSLLRNDRANIKIIRSSLGYFSNQSDMRGIEFARRYAQPGMSEEVRFAALYALASLGEQTSKEQIIQLLRSQKSDNRQYLLLLGLANISTDQEFDKSTAFINKNTKHYKSAKRVNKFVKSSGQAKRRHALEMLNKSYSPLERRKGVRYLLESNQTDELKEMLKPSSQNHKKIIIRNEIRKNNYNVVVKGERVSINPNN